MELPIKEIVLQEYPQAGRFSSTKYQVCIYFSDGRKSEYAYGSTIKALRKNLEFIYGKLMTKTFLPLVYSKDAITLLRNNDG